MKKKSEKKSLADVIGLSETLKALAHPIRLEIIQLFCNCNCERMTVKSVYEHLKIEQPVASKHLGILKRNDVMKRETEKNFAWFRLNTESALVKCLIDHLMKKT